MTSKYQNLLTEKILAKIHNSSEKKITFADYMKMCLYDPEFGYYNQNNIAIGNEGDFFTSASLSDDFGELLAKQLLQFWEVLQKSEQFTLVEMGAGEGLLAKNILLYIINKYPDFSQILKYIIIEKSSTLKIKQQQVLTDLIAKGINISWQTWDNLTDDSLTGCFFSNELVDAFPVHLITFNNGNLKEIYITENLGKLVKIADEISTTEILNYFELININFDSNLYPDNYQTEVNLQAFSWLKQVSKKLKKGYLLTIDYGYNAEKYYHPQRSEGTLQCYYKHRYHNNPLVNIGCQDITSHVNFTALDKYGELVGLHKLAYTQQALFLMNLGLGDRLNALSNGTIPVSLIWQKRNQLHQLINPQGLGNFGVLLQGKNLNSTEIKFPLQGFISYI
jgi:SAM-dependent MidA family methyltransferase